MVEFYSKRVKLKLEMVEFQSQLVKFQNKNGSNLKQYYSNFQFFRAAQCWCPQVHRCHELDPRHVGRFIWRPRSKRRGHYYFPFKWATRQGQAGRLQAAFAVLDVDTQRRNQQPRVHRDRRHARDLHVELGQAHPQSFTGTWLSFF